MLTVHGELGAVKDVELARFELSLDLFDLLCGAFGCGGTELGEGNGTRSERTRPVGSDLFAV